MRTSPGGNLRLTRFSTVFMRSVTFDLIGPPTNSNAN